MTQLESVAATAVRLAFAPPDSPTASASDTAVALNASLTTLCRLALIYHPPSGHCPPAVDLCQALQSFARAALKTAAGRGLRSARNGRRLRDPFVRLAQV